MPALSSERQSSQIYWSSEEKWKIIKASQQDKKKGGASKWILFVGLSTFHLFQEKNEIVLEIWTFDIHLRKRTNILTYIKPFREILIFRLMWQIPYNVTFKKKKTSEMHFPWECRIGPSLLSKSYTYYILSSIYNL